MKKVVFAVIVVVFIFGMLVSCNKSVCPAYVIDNSIESVQNNG